MQCLANISDSSKLNGRRYRKSRKKYISKKRFQYEAKTFFGDQANDFDYAVAYDMAEECLKFVRDIINAQKKYAFVHCSYLTEPKAEIYSSFDRIICVNNLVAKRLNNDYPHISNKVLDIENYLDPKWVIYESDKAKNIDKPKNDLVLCSCGWLSKVKGFDLAVESAAILKQKNIDFHWFFVGEVRDDGYTEKLIEELHMEDRITITGFIDNPFGYMKMCDVYVQPSREEAHATTMVECMILCIPMVSTDTISGKYFKEKYNCCILAKTDPTDLAEKIIRVFNDSEERNALIQNDKSINYSELKKQYKNNINAIFD